jgi:hypothetical protein
VLKQTRTFLKMDVFWDVAPYSLVEVNRHFGGTSCLHHQGETTWRNIPEDSQLHTRRRENLKSHLVEYGSDYCLVVSKVKRQTFNK